MSLQVRIGATGDSGTLELVTQDPGPPGPGQIRLRQSAIGVNFVDIYHRTGLYPLPALPAVLGVEGAGRIEAIGPGVSGLAIGERVAYGGSLGGYATSRLLPADRAVRLPDAVDDRTAAAAMLRGMTAHMLLHRLHPVGPGSRVLVTAAAGGLGQMLVRWAKELGAGVIGTVGRPDKLPAAQAAGADLVLSHADADFPVAVRAATDGGVDLAIDGIGGEVLRRSLDCVRPFGLVASAGQAGGSLPVLEMTELGPRRSIALARPSVMAYIADLATYRIAADAVIARLAAGLAVTVGMTYPLAEARRAHDDLEAGRTNGSLLLIP